MRPPDGNMARRERWIGRAIFSLLVVFTLCWLATTWPACYLLWRATRHGPYERPVLRWTLKWNGHPIIQDFADGRIRPGEPLDERLLREPVQYSSTYGRYEWRCYLLPSGRGRSLSLWTKDGRVVVASSTDGIGDYCFFSTMTREDGAEIEEHRAAELRLQQIPTAAFIGGVGVMHPTLLTDPPVYSD